MSACRRQVPILYIDSGTVYVAGVIVQWHLMLKGNSGVFRLVDTLPRDMRNLSL